MVAMTDFDMVGVHKTGQRRPAERRGIARERAWVYPENTSQNVAEGHPDAGGPPRRLRLSSIKATATGYRPPNRDGVGELDIAAVRHAAREARHANAERLELLCEKEGRGFAVNRGRRRDEHLLHDGTVLTTAHAQLQLLYWQLVGADSFER